MQAHRNRHTPHTPTDENNSKKTQNMDSLLQTTVFNTFLNILIEKCLLSSSQRNGK